MSRLVFDIEADDYLPGATQMWVLRTEDIDTGEKCRFIACQGDDGWKEKLETAEMVVGHNICGFDLPLLEKLYDYKLPASVRVRDTFVLSITMDYRRFGFDGHSLGAWGTYLGKPKGDFEDFSQYSEEMDMYCEQDVSINVDVYKILEAELKSLLPKAPYLPIYLKSEQAVARWQAIAEWKGWPFQRDAAFKLRAELEDINGSIRDKLESVLGNKIIPKDRMPDPEKTVGKWIEACDKNKPPFDVEQLEILSDILLREEGLISAPKFPKWVGAGCYDAHTANWFDIDPWSGHPEEYQPIMGPYSRIEHKALSLSSPADVKIFLGRNGWVPSEWNYKFNPETKRKEKTSPKIAEDDLEFLGPDGKLYADFKSFSSRLGVVKTWCEESEGGKLHGKSFCIGTASMRMRHQIIANVPTPDKPYGEEMRKLFICEEGEILVGGDSAGNQARGLAYYIDNADFTYNILHGDIHEYNATALTQALNEMGVDLSRFPDNRVPRARAKRILYAFLFGAAGGKLWGYVFDTMDSTQGEILKRKFTQAVPGFEDLVDSLKAIFSSTKKFGYGYIYSLAGNKIYVDSYHKLLVYLLQACEKITCAAALMLAMERMEEEGIPYTPCIMYHDEMNARVAIEHGKRTQEIFKQAFIDGPKMFNVQIMDGDAKIGASWYEIH